MVQLDSTAEKVLVIIQTFVIATGSEHTLRMLTPNAQLDRDLSIDSLGRVELLHRLERTFQITFPENIVTEVQTVQDLINAVQRYSEPKVSLSHVPMGEGLGERAVVHDNILQASPLTPLPAYRKRRTELQTLVEVLLYHVAKHPQQPHLYFQNEFKQEEVINYQQLFKHAQTIATALKQHGIMKGDTVALMLPTSTDFFYAFIGILLCGAVPVPIYPPLKPEHLEDYIRLEANILRNAEVRLLISFAAVHSVTKILKNLIPSLLAVVTVAKLMKQEADVYTLPDITTEDPALIQYTSGSTGNPKGVLLLHRNILANIRAMQTALQLDVTDSCVSWLPLYHDMGLMSWLTCLYLGVPFICMSPLTFLLRPERWLWALHSHRATISAGPNFAYELCIRKIKDKEIEGLDLSAWRCALNGAEAVNPLTLVRFNKKFAPYGLLDTTLLPVYGLAENTVGLLTPELNRVAKVDKIKREPFEQQHRAISADTNSRKKDTLTFVCCGKPIPGHAVRLLDANDVEITAERQVGSLQFKGPSAMQGYYHNASTTQAVYFDGWWDSGDLAYQAEGEFYIVGRKKDIIIKAGRNYSAEEIEAIANEVEGVRKGRVVAFGVSDEELGSERIVVVAETQVENKEEQQRIQKQIVEAIAINLGYPADQVIIVAAGTIGKTSSGKLQRAQCKQAYIKNQLHKPKKKLAWQFGKLWFFSGAKKIAKVFSTLAKAVYSLYLLIIFTILLPIILCLFLLPKKITAKFLRVLARAFLFLAACPITITHSEYLTRYKPMLYVANHASYVDAILLFAILPAGVSFVVKEELQKIPVLNHFFKKLNCIPVNRTDVSDSLADTNKIQEKIQRGSSIMIFPEGTFTYAADLKAFKSGAFKLAVDNSLPICPITIMGTRKILRAGKFLPRPSQLFLHVSKPLLPQSQDWEEVAHLSKLVRATMNEVLIK